MYYPNLQEYFFIFRKLVFVPYHDKCIHFIQITINNYSYSQRRDISNAKSDK